MALGRACLLGLALSSVVAASSFAQELGSPEPYTGPDGPYIRIEGGLSHLNDEKGEGLGSQGSTLNFGSSQDLGYIAGGAAGYKFGQLRTELGLDFSGHSVSGIQLNNDGGLGGRLGTGSLSGASGNPSGNVNATAIMANFLWDFRTGTPFVPYIGIGVGGARVSLDDFRVGGVGLSNSSDIVFAYQPMVGVRYLLNDQLAVGLEYRYLATTQPEFKDSSGVPFHGRYESHNILASLSYSFGAPPAPPPPAPAAYVPVRPAPAAPAAQAPKEREYIVFFEFDRATLTPEGARVIDAAAAAYQSDGASHIHLVGYTDAAGTQAYNLELSKRRAEVVRDYLAHHGVPLEQIEANWRGKENQRVPTANGVREPQNRRVEIFIP